MDERDVVGGMKLILEVEYVAVKGDVVGGMRWIWEEVGYEAVKGDVVDGMRWIWEVWVRKGVWMGK